MTTVMYNGYSSIRARATRRQINVTPLLMAGLVGLLLWRLGPAAAIGACAIVVGRRVGAGRSTGVTQWLKAAARVRAASVTFGVALIVASAFVHVPSAINSAADLRGAVGYLAVQCAGFMGAPLLALLSVQSLRNAAKQGRKPRLTKSLSCAPRQYSPVRMKIAA